ncbi:cobalamin-dependent protein [Catenulispora yoronensis]|uniref:Cobalamin-dependent protein n=2 Tax=Catenulispora yoronensis TaxID=450799 RepID=A0ABN2TIX3_9ACTN
MGETGDWSIDSHSGRDGTTGAPAVLTAETVDGYWDALMARDESAALATAWSALDCGVPAETVVLDLVGAAQSRVGAEWAANLLTVAQEHAATALGDRVLAALGGHPGYRRHAPAPRGRVTVACVDGEWHAMPARLLAEVLSLGGWRVDFLGAHVPGPHLISHLHESGPDVVALSATLALRLPDAHAAITACQAASVPVLAGGAAFGPHGEYARLLGADAWAGDARAALAVLDRPLPRPRPPHQAVDDLPHLADQEYTHVAANRSRIVSAIVAALQEQVPAMRDYTPQQMQYTIEDIDHIVRFLASALYVDDAALFAGFIAWTRAILSDRGVPPHALTSALDLLGTQLRDFPRATSLNAAGHAAMEARAA